MLALTDYEMALVADEKVLLAKNKIIQTVQQIFGELSEEYARIISDSSFEKNFLNNAKISRGENYRGLPYVVLDYPRQFSKNSVFAIRSFFWWGNFFSITLQLSGEHFEQRKDFLGQWLSVFQKEGWYINAGNEQWEHHFDADNYKPFIGAEIISAEQKFIKLAKKIPLSEWDSVKNFYLENFTFLIKTLNNYAPIL
jgi:hypothetical protein